MQMFKPKTTILGVTWQLDAEKKPKRIMPTPIGYAKHFQSHAARLKFEADPMTVPERVFKFVPIYKGVSNAVLKAQHNAERLDQRDQFRKLMAEIEAEQIKITERVDAEPEVKAE